MPAAGVMPVGGNDATEQMIDMNLQSVNGVSRPNGWVRRWQYSNRWLHSDLKDIAYYYVFNLYERLVQAGGLQ